MTIKELTHYLGRRGCNLSGCSTTQVAKIETFYTVKLPLTYVEFLLAMGRSADKFMLGSSAFYDEIFDLRAWGIELLLENNFKELPADTFVFWMHQGYQFAFFHLNEEDDPPVYFYYEGRTKNEFELIENSFTGFLESQIAMSGLDK